MMTKLLALASLILRNLSIPKKMLLLSVLLLAPLLIQTGLFIQRTNTDIDVVRTEKKGIEYNAELKNLLQLLPLYRDASYGLSQQRPEFLVRKQQLSQAVEAAVEKIDRIDWRLGKQLRISEHWIRIKSRWQILSNDSNTPAEKQFEEYSQLIEDLLATIVLVADNSGLVLDPNIETYYLMMLMVYEVPKMINTAQKLRGLSRAPDEDLNLFGEGALHIPTLIGLLREQQTQVIKMQSKVLQENPGLREKMGMQLEETLQHLAHFSSEMLREGAQRNGPERFKLASTTVDSLFQLYDLSAFELDALLEQQIVKLEVVRNSAVISITLCFLIGLYLFAGFYYSLVRDLTALVTASKRIGSGYIGHRIVMHGRDELNTVAKGFNDMAKALEESQHEVNEAYRKLERLTKSDPLTGLANRRFLDEVLAREWQRAIRNNSALSVLMLDIDHFKQFNDLYGHAAGDECLCKVASELGVIMKRGGDFVARYGGEEFIIISPETDIDQAAELALTVQKSIESLFVEHEGSATSKYVTVSIGVASMKPKKMDGTSKCLVEQADRALYKAKGAGRNCYVVEATSKGPQLVKKLYPNNGNGSAF